MAHSNVFLQNRDEQTDFNIAGNSMVAAPTHSELNKFAEVQKKSLSKK